MCRVLFFQVIRRQFPKEVSEFWLSGKSSSCFVMNLKLPESVSLHYANA